MRYYSSNAVATTLSGNITNSATSISVASVSGFPVQYPYTLSIDADNVNKELVQVASAVGTTLTVTRGVDGTAAVAHSLGAKVSHDHSARDFRESRDHEAATVAHGTTGNIVGTTDTQVITNKDLTSGTNAFPAALATDTELASAVAAEASARGTAVAAEATARANADALKQDAATAATLAGAQTLTNKNLTSGTNTFPTSLVTLTGTQTLTNKTLTSPTISTPTISGGTETDQAHVRNGKTAKVPYYVATDADLPSTGVADGDLAVVLAGTDGYQPTRPMLKIRKNGGWYSPDSMAWFDAAPTIYTDWVLQGTMYYKESNPIAALRGSVKYTGSTITAGATGNITNKAVLGVGAVGFQPVADVNFIMHSPNAMWRARLESTGDITIMDGVPGATINNLDILTFNFAFPV